MANLRGGTFEKQVKDAFHRLAKFGEKRHGSSDHGTHSDALAIKREMYLRDFAKFAKSIGIDGKINDWMGDQNLLKEFLSDRIDGLSKSTSIDYISGFNSMIQGLRESNITIDRGADRAIDLVRTEVKNWDKPDYRVDRSFQNPDQVISNLQQIRFESSVIAEIQREFGYRTSEAYELAKNPEEYIKDNQIIGIIGKGNHEYIAKPISSELIEKLQNINQLPSHNIYLKHIKEASENDQAVAHDWRYTFAKETMESKLADGKSYNEALKEVSKEMNHHRPDITEYYLARS
ncbi:MAG: hypothetical protein DSY46_02950 [Hydrogenimonas sp.]|nr:MAG: hypothetical protein DSY46_02950 [Hydrogenimonas sp.]